MRRGRRVIIKRRNTYSEQLAELSNVYFRMAGIPIRFWARIRDWQLWERQCFNMLNGDRFSCSRPARQNSLRRQAARKSLWDPSELGHAYTRNDGSSRSRITASASIPERRISRAVVARRRRHEQCDLRLENRPGAID